MPIPKGFKGGGAVYIAVLLPWSVSMYALASAAHAHPYAGAIYQLFVVSFVVTNFSGWGCCVLAVATPIIWAVGRLIFPTARPGDNARFILSKSLTFLVIGIPLILLARFMMSIFGEEIRFSATD